MVNSPTPSRVEGLRNTSRKVWVGPSRLLKLCCYRTTRRVSRAAERALACTGSGPAGAVESVGARSAMRETVPSCTAEGVELHAASSGNRASQEKRIGMQCDERGRTNQPLLRNEQRLGLLPLAPKWAYRHSSMATKAALKHSDDTWFMRMVCSKLAAASSCHTSHAQRLNKATTGPVATRKISRGRSSCRSQ